MEQKVDETIRKYNMIKAGDKIVVGLSGGADSVALLVALSRLKEKYAIELAAVHINHGIRGSEAQRDCEFSKSLCKKLGIDFLERFFDVPKEAVKMGMGEEECGRTLRYKAFYEVVAKKKFSKIAVAHNMNDQAETVLMRIARGTGTTGLRGISPVRDIIIRPLIECSRKEIENYLEKIGQSYCTDSSNLKSDYTRNKIRINILPYFEKEINPKTVANIAKTAELVSLEDEYMEDVAMKAYENALLKKNANEVYLSVDALKAVEHVILRRVIRISLRNFKSDIKDFSLEHINKVTKLFGAQSGKRVVVAGAFEARREYANVVISNGAAKKAQDYCYELFENKAVYVKEANVFVEISDKKIKFDANGRKVCTKAFDCDKISKNIVVRNRRPKDFIAIQSGHKKLKDFFIDEKVPREERNLTPLIVCGNEVFWVVGKRQSCSCSATKDTKKIAYIHIWGALEDG